MQDSVIPLGSLADLRLVWPGTAPSLATAPTMAIWLDIPNLVPEAAGSGLIQAVQQGTKKSPGTSSFLLGNPPPPPAPGRDMDLLCQRLATALGERAMQSTEF